MNTDTLAQDTNYKQKIKKKNYFLLTSVLAVMTRSLDQCESH